MVYHKNQGWVLCCSFFYINKLSMNLGGMVSNISGVVTVQKVILQQDID